jgi:peptidoglycan/LPS O-acetylase OafA/YrhL
MSILLQRPVNNLSPIHALFYFSTAYSTGIFCSIYKDKIYYLLKNKEFHLFAAILGLAAFQAWKYPTVTIFAKPAFTYWTLDILHMQKILFCLFFMVLLNRFEGIQIKPLAKLANASFAIYFLHGFVIRGVATIIRRCRFEFYGSFISWLVITIIIVIAAYFLSVGLKKIIGDKRSRFIIGW